jgi:hypothetical protein
MNIERNEPPGFDLIALAVLPARSRAAASAAVRAPRDAGRRLAG